MFPEFIFAHAMEERLMANLVLETLKEAGVKVNSTGRTKFDVASAIGNLEWRNVFSFLAGFLHWRRRPIEGPSDDAQSWLGRLPRMRKQDPPPQEVTSKLETIGDVTDQGQLPNNDTDLASSALKSSQLGQARVADDATPSTSPPPEQAHEWCITHAIFANMGGFRLSSKTHNNPIAHRTIDGFELASLLTTGKIARIPDISKADILDKSKTDAFARWLAVLQCLWLLRELIARQIEGLPSSQIEIATLAFACCSILTYIAVRDKPKDVDVPLEVRLNVALPESTSLDPLFETQKSFVLEVFVYKYWQPENYKSLIPGPGRIPSKKMRIQWRGQDITGHRIRNDNYLVRDYRSHPMAGWMVIGSIIFGGIHCVAWDHYFPTRAERILWRISALVTTFAPLLLPIIDRGANSIRRYFNLSTWGSTLGRVATNGWAVVVPAMVLLSYVLLRMCIVVLVFASLREMPAEVFVLLGLSMF